MRQHRIIASPHHHRHTQPIYPIGGNCHNQDGCCLPSFHTSLHATPLDCNMSTTPPGRTNQPAKTPGFTAALFGLFSSKKPSRAVDSSTVPTTSVTRSPRNSHRQMDISLTSPSEHDYGMTTTNNSNSHTTTASDIDLLDTNGPSGSPPAAKLVAASLAFKSPWKSPSAPTMNGVSTLNVQFSVGNLKPAPPAGRRSISRKTRRYKPSTLLLGAKRRKTGPFNTDNAVNALQHSQNLFQPSSRQLEARSNYTSFRAGKRLLGSSQRGGSRLVPPDPTSKDASIRADQEEEASSPVEPATKRRKQVMFGADAMDSKPIESEMMTPVRPAGDFTRKKATPFKPSAYAESGPAVPTQSPATSLSSSAQTYLTTRSVVKMQLEMGRYTFEEPNEAEPLGPPVATRTPRFQGATRISLETGNVDAAKLSTLQEFYEKQKVEAKASAKPQNTDNATPNDYTSATPNDGTRATAVTGTWGNLFASQKAKWKCGTCLASNEQDVYKCACCEASRPGHEDKASKNSGGAGGTSQASIGTGGFSFGDTVAAPASSTGGFSFGNAPAPSASPPMTGGFSFAGGNSSSASTPSGGGFSFGGAPSSASTGDVGGGFKFGATPAAPPAAAPAPAKDSNSTSKGGFSFGSTPAGGASTEEGKEATKPLGFSFVSTPTPAPTNEEKKPFKFNVSGDEKKSEDAPKSTFVFPSSSTPPLKAPDLPIPATEPMSKRTRPENGGNSNMPSSANKASDLNTDSSSKPTFSFGANGSSSVSSSFNFGSTPAPATEPARAPTFKFGEQPSSVSGTKALPALGSIPSKESPDDDRSKRRRGRDDGDSSSAPAFGGNASSAPASTPAFSFGGSAPAPAPTTFGSQPSKEAPVPIFGASAPVPAPAPATGGFSFGGAPSSSSSASAFKFGSAPDGDSSSAPNPPASAPLFGNSQGAGAPPAFGGSAPTPAPSNANPFGSAPAAPAPASGFSFGGGGSSGDTGPAFGSTPAAAAPTFGSGPTPGASFGSGPAAGAPTFGAAPTPAGFGSTPASGPGSFGAPPSAPFGSTPAASAPPAFGSTPASDPFGGTPGGGFGGGGFGGAPPAPAPASFGAPFGGAPSPAPGGFGGGFGAPAPPPPAPGGFGAPPAPGGFGGGGGGGFGGLPAGGDAPQFSLGTGGGGASRTPGRRRILKARRPKPA